MHLDDAKSFLVDDRSTKATSHNCQEDEKLRTRIVANVWRFSIKHFNRIGYRQCPSNYGLGVGDIESPLTTLLGTEFSLDGQIGWIPK